MLHMNYGIYVTFHKNYIINYVCARANENASK